MKEYTDELMCSLRFTEYNLRNSNTKHTLPMPFLKRSFGFSGENIWNDLQSLVRTLNLLGNVKVQ